jgi:hypothetical protein
MFLLQSAFCQFRKYSNEFLNIGAGTRGMAMGGAQVAIVNDATAGYWNPAGLMQVKDHPNLNIMHADYFSGIAKYDYAALALPLKNNTQTLGFSLLRFAVDDIPNTLFLVEPDGSINYNNIQSFSSADYAFLISYAQSLNMRDGKGWSIGGNAKVIHRKVGRFAKAWGMGLDAGVQYRNGKWQFGAVIKDMTSTYNAWTFQFTEREKEVLYLTNNDIPIRSNELTAPRLTIGGSYDFKINNKLQLLAVLDADFLFDGKRNTVISSNLVNLEPHAGLEVGFKDIFHVRAGVGNFQQALSDGDTLNQKKVWIFQPSLGAGFKIKHMTIDYAFSNLANQSSPLFTHVFSLKLNLVKKEPIKNEQ